jgi:DNA-binding CsgD family transcriptional regulator
MTKESLNKEKKIAKLLLDGLSYDEISLKLKTPPYKVKHIAGIIYRMNDTTTRYRYMAKAYKAML